MKQKSEYTKPDWIFEVSWEVCNKVGGINTVIATKAKVLVDETEDKLVLIGPDLRKHNHNGKEFIEDASLFAEWKSSLLESNLNVSIGRWDIPGRPIVILIDFDNFFERKDDILSQLWIKYRVDSLTGGWDYIEPVIFGYVSGMVIESFYHHCIQSNQHVVAQFHEWMTGAGLLYLKDKLPQLATAFTSHATVMGRSIAGNNFPLYDDLEKYDANEITKTFHIQAKHSLETKSALHADVFTTVSEITARECRHFLDKTPDHITPNGFDSGFILGDNFETRRLLARTVLKRTAEAVLNQKIDEDAIFVIKSGRYEFRNKGVDVFLDALHKLNITESLHKQFVVFFTIPAGHKGLVEGVMHRTENPDFSNPNSNQYLTHHLNSYQDDPIIVRIQNNSLFNRMQDKVKIIYSPVYLDGFDGIYNMHYYDLLPGMDFGAFTSYYEPWGYTPLESIASRIPAITTNVAGFGSWVEKNAPQYLNNAVFLVERNDRNQDACSTEIAKILREFSEDSNEQVAFMKEKAAELAAEINWERFISEYFTAYGIAFQKVFNRKYLFENKKSRTHVAKMHSIPPGDEATPAWRKLFVEPKVPKSFSILYKLALNLWTNWNNDARDLFEMLDAEIWNEFKENPTAALEAISYERLLELEKDEYFCKKLWDIEFKFNAYMEERANLKGPKVAYFCMEYGLDPVIKLYSGGLGVLAGDFLKEASDAKTNMVAVGLLYRFGYFKQQLSENSEQVAIYKPQKFSYLPIKPVKDKSDTWVTIEVELAGKMLYAKVWVLQVGSVPLYLLDTDIEKNDQQDRFITHQLYGGDWDNRLKQEILLGIGGIRLLKKLGIAADVYHCNEGHAALTSIERLRLLMEEEKLDFLTAAEVVKASSVFTTHTPVPAGHDAFEEEAMRKYFEPYAEHLETTWHGFMALGRSNPNNHHEKFSMSFLAARMSAVVNGVSKLHGTVSKDIFRPMYSGYFKEEINIDYVTNGVHYPTWASKKWQELYQQTFDEGFYTHQHNADFWSKIHTVNDEIIWNLRLEHKRKLISWLKENISKNPEQKHQGPRGMLKMLNSLDENALIIGFARRFATYKRAALILTDPDRLASIISESNRPVVFLFAGKAHPKDIPGQDLIKKIVEISKTNQFLGKIIFIEDYNMKVAKYLVQGVDIWLNTPSRPMEASGTSGMKATLNGVLNLSVLDGWWAEGYKEETGWALPMESTYDYEAFQNEFDAETIYSLLEKEIKPLFFDRDRNGIPVDWIKRIKNTIAEIAPQFTMTRMLREYESKYYEPLQMRCQQVKQDNYKIAYQLAEWKRKVSNNWNQIKVVSMDVFDSTNQALSLGEPFTAKIVLTIGDLLPEEIGIEVVFIQRKNTEEDVQIVRKEELELVSFKNRQAIFECSVNASKSGVYEYGFRVSPRHPLTSKRMDFPLMKWI